MEIYIAGPSGPLTMKNVWTLAPNVGKIEIEVADANDNYINTADLASGYVSEVDVSKPTGPRNVSAVYMHPFPVR